MLGHLLHTQHLVAARDALQGTQNTGKPRDRTKVRKVQTTFRLTEVWLVLFFLSLFLWCQMPLLWFSSLLVGAANIPCLVCRRLLRCPVDFHGKRIASLFWEGLSLKESAESECLLKRRKKSGHGKKQGILSWLVEFKGIGTLPQKSRNKEATHWATEVGKLTFVQAPKEVETRDS